MKTTLLASAVFLISGMAFASGEPTLQCYATNFARVATSTEGEGGTVDTYETIPFELSVGQNKIVEMGGAEERFIVLKIAHLGMEESMTGKATYLVDATLVSKTMRSTPGEFLPMDVIARTSFYVPELNSGLYAFSKGRLPKNTDGKEVLHDRLLVYCSSQK
jgi:hypothetical protein